MTSFILGLISGSILGGAIGLTIMALCVASSKTNAEYERLQQNEI